MLGSIISTIGNVASGIFNAKKQEKYAKNALQWKAADAEKAGISKIYAMGAPTHSFNPVSIGADPGLASSIDKTISGQSGPHGTTTGKISGISSAIQAAQLDGLKIDNDIKRADLASKLNIATQPGAGGIMDRDVTQGPGGVQMEKKIAPSSPGQFNRSFGVSPEVDLYRTKEGYAPQIPQQLQEAFESDALGRYQWNMRNKLLPYMNMDAYGTPAHPAPAGSFWTYDPLMGQYVLTPRGGSKSGPRAHKWEYLMDRLRR